MKLLFFAILFFISPLPSQGQSSKKLRPKKLNGDLGKPTNAQRLQKLFKSCKKHSPGQRFTQSIRIDADLVFYCDPNIILAMENHPSGTDPAYADDRTMQEQGLADKNTTVGDPRNSKKSAPTRRGKNAAPGPADQ